MATSSAIDLGPLAFLPGVWEGGNGEDTAPSPERGTELNPFRERWECVSIGAVDNHEQKLHVVRYSLMAWEKGSPDPFHEECGYYSWEEATGTVSRGFVVPRGVALIASGLCSPDSAAFELLAEPGRGNSGIAESSFLDREFRVVSFSMKLRLLNPDSFFYEQDTVLKMPGRKDLFHHTDRNTLRRTV